MKVDNAIIMAAGTSSRFAPLSLEKHKALTVVKGEILIERQIKQIKEVGINDVFVVTGYKKEQFEYLVNKFGIQLIHNPEYLYRNNNGSIWVARDVIDNSYICSSDNYFSENPFEGEVEDSYYAAEYANGYTKEWCMTEDEEGYINSVTIGGENAWYMMGHTFWSHDFSSKFIDILSAQYNKPETVDLLWENIFMANLDVLKMRIRKYEPDIIHEFDTLDELREFDVSYINNTRSTILNEVSKRLQVEEKQINNITNVKGQSFDAIGFEFDCMGKHYQYIYDSKELCLAL